MANAYRWIEVATFGAVYEADIAVATLESAGIPARVGGGEHVGIFGAGYQGFTARGVAVLVPENHADDARELLMDEPPEV
ncbi:MAG TPA: DUF2007 domain-containing protein [Longimicrobiaceae bacterium]|nr:DUF2007 domain-containing protein [Longimicrobiaceae bacterium]